MLSPFRRSADTYFVFILCLSVRLSVCLCNVCTNFIIILIIITLGIYMYTTMVLKIIIGEERAEIRRPRCSLHLWANCGRDLGRFERISSSPPRWSWKEDLWKHGRGSRDQLPVPKDLDLVQHFNAVLLHEFAGYRLMIVSNFVFSSQFFKLPWNYMYRELKNNNNNNTWWIIFTASLNSLTNYTWCAESLQ